MTDVAPESQKKEPFKKIALFLQGGGALGSYEGGAYQALHEVGLEPQIVSGISIGAFNGAVIAGNKPEERVNALKAFWEDLTVELDASRKAKETEKKAKTPQERAAAEKMHASADAESAQHFAIKGIPYLARPRPEFERLRTMVEAANAGKKMSFVPEVLKEYVLSPMFTDMIKQTTEFWVNTLKESVAVPTSYFLNDAQPDLLKRHVDFNSLNAHSYVERFAAGAADATTGESVFFDSGNVQITPQHIMASGALVPAVPIVDIDGRGYVDGGFVGNNPRKWAVDNNLLDSDTLSIKIHLFDPKDGEPKTMDHMESMKHRMTHSDHGEDRSASDAVREKNHQAFEKLSPDQQKEDWAQDLKKIAEGKDCGHVIDVVYHPPAYALSTNTSDFSRSSMESRWAKGYRDTIRALCTSKELDRFKPEVIQKLAVHILKEYPEVLQDPQSSHVRDIIYNWASSQLTTLAPEHDGPRYENIRKALCKPEHLQHLSSEVISMLAPHILMSYQNMIKDLSQPVLDIICSKEVLRNSKHSMNDVLKNLTPENLRILSERCPEFMNNIESALKPILERKLHPTQQTFTGGLDELPPDKNPGMFF